MEDLSGSQAVARGSNPRLFNAYIDRYDAWYDSPRGQALLASEVECLKPLLERFPRPYLEVGVGTGRFAEALGTEYGADPSYEALKRACRKGIKAVLSVGEALPFKNRGFGAVHLVFALCFVQDPEKVLREIHRVLLEGGGLVLGLLLKGTPWADYYAKRGREGDPLYRDAYFHSREEVERLLAAGGFSISAYRSTLFQRPGLEVYEEERPVEGCSPKAGFVAVSAVKL